MNPRIAHEIDILNEKIQYYRNEANRIQEFLDFISENQNILSDEDLECAIAFLEHTHLYTKTIFQRVAGIE